jgi:NAD(P)H-hydrate epimerase
MSYIFADMNVSFTHLQPVVTAAEMAEMDRRTIEEIGIPGAVLMENAARGIVRAILERFGSMAGKRVLVLCGKGNNGGDGYVVTRYLADHGAHLNILILGEKAQIRGDAKLNLDILERLGIETMSISKWHPETITGQDLIIDAMLGTGVTGRLKKLYAEAVESVNSSGVPVVAVDIPTGLHTDRGTLTGPAIIATLTVSMAFPKRGHLLYPGAKNVGELRTVDIGIPSRVVESSGARTYRLTHSWIRSILPERPRDTFKNKCGQVFVLAGSAGMTGAAVLTSMATLRTGAGMAILGIPKSLNAILENKLTEVMTMPLPETDNQSLSAESLPLLEEKLDWSNVLALGPGITTHEDSVRLVGELLGSYKKPVVLDADGLNCAAVDSSVLKNSAAPLVLTPHPGELARLTGGSSTEILDDPIEAAKSAAMSFNAVVVLKSAPVVIASPDGYAFLNCTGNPGMATAGLGDVLTGVIAGLVAQGVQPLPAALAGVYLHGFAGDLVAAEKGEDGLVAGDVAEMLPQAIRQTRLNDEIYSD